jgi:SAM-dependent methyltransferase
MRFFTPTPEFWKWLKATVKKHPKMPIIDCGCGYGQLVREMRQAGYPAIGLDPRFDIFDEKIPLDLVGAIYAMEAEHFPLVRSTPSILFTCRPCHSGFPVHINRVRPAGSVFFYIGLEKNLELDMEDGTYRLATKKVVGEEGEKIWEVSKN